MTDLEQLDEFFVEEPRRHRLVRRAWQVTAVALFPAGVAVWVYAGVLIARGWAP